MNGVRALSFNEVAIRNMNLFQDQQKRIESLCSAINANTTVYNSRLVTDLYHHLLVDDARKLLFCYVPKVRGGSIMGESSHYEILVMV